MEEFDTSVEIRKVDHGLIQETQLTLLIKDLPSVFENYKIVSLTDFHCGIYTNQKVIEAALNLAQEKSPNLIFILGDYIHSGRQNFKLALLKLIGMRRSKYRSYRRSALKSAKLLSEALLSLNPTDGIYSVWGNHDYIEGRWILSTCLPPSIVHLKNRFVSITKSDENFAYKLGIFGLDDYREGEPDLSEINNSDLKNCQIKIFLSHNPDFVLLPEAEEIYNYNLILSGHTHGGQVCFPGGIPIKTETRQRKYCSGFYRFGKSPFYIANGIGCSGLPIRLNCPPEVLTISLYKK